MSDLDFLEPGEADLLRRARPLRESAMNHIEHASEKVADTAETVVMLVDEIESAIARRRSDLLFGLSFKLGEAQSEFDRALARSSRSQKGGGARRKYTATWLIREIHCHASLNQVLRDLSDFGRCQLSEDLELWSQRGRLVASSKISYRSGGARSNGFCACFAQCGPMTTLKPDDVPTTSSFFHRFPQHSVPRWQAEIQEALRMQTTNNFLGLSHEEIIQSFVDGDVGQQALQDLTEQRVEERTELIARLDELRTDRTLDQASAKLRKDLDQLENRKRDLESELSSVKTQANQISSHLSSLSSRREREDLGIEARLRESAPAMIDEVRRAVDAELEVTRHRSQLFSEEGRIYIAELNTAREALKALALEVPGDPTGRIHEILANVRNLKLPTIEGYELP